MPDLQISFDVGHSSIGWAVIRTPERSAANGTLPEILGTGVVTFGADDCLAVKRRKNRQARRHARATRQRIGHMEKLLSHLGVLSADKLKDRHRQAGGDSFAWQRAAEILTATRAGKPLPKIGWPELWDILRWYAHNRGYFAPPWAKRGDELPEDDDAVPDTEKVKIAHATMMELGTQTMAETIAAYTEWYEREAAKWQQKQRDTKPVHFKGLNAAFPREDVVWPEVRALLQALKGSLPKLDDTLIRALLGNDIDPMRDREAWRAISCPSIVLPKRYHGGLLFGQSIPRFDNRIIGVCPILFARLETQYRQEGLESAEAKERAEKEAKLPSKASTEFLRFRWAMQLANVFGSAPGERSTRPLSADERKKLTGQAEGLGAFTKGEFKKAIRLLTGWTRDNLDNLLLHPDAEKALVLDPVQLELCKSRLADAFARLPLRYAKRLRGKLSDGKTVTAGEVRCWLEPADASAFDDVVAGVLDGTNTRKGRKQSVTSRDDLLSEKLTAQFPAGRAPYARPILREAYGEVMTGHDPRAEKSERQPRGCLCQTDELKEAQLHRRLEKQTNNHLIRHRLLILERLLRDLIAAPEFANGDAKRVASLVIEVNRDLRDQSGKTRKEQEQDLGLRLGDFKRVAAKVEEACKSRGVPVTAGLIRKARVAEDLGWKCPYTGRMFEMNDLLGDRYDKDHIIPHSDRQSDSLDSLVITTKEVNLWKGKRTAMQFVREEGGKVTPGRPAIMPLVAFQKHVAGLNIYKGHPDDQTRKKRRIRRLLTENYEEKEFTPRDLTMTSHLVRLGAQVLQRAFPPGLRPPVVSLPGSVTGEVRKAWRLIGCLGAANPAIFEADGKTPKRKEDIRGITHLHHALDACVLGLAALYFPRNGAVWGAMVKAGTDRNANDERRLWLAMTKRRPTGEEAALLRATGLYQADASGRMHLAELPAELQQQLRRRLAEKRVVQHVPADMSGVKVEENTRGVAGEKGGRVLLRQRAGRDAKTGLQAVKTTDEAPGKLLGLKPINGDGKLMRQNGVRVITDNFGVAILDHAPEGEEKFVVIPWHRVWHRLAALKVRNSGKRPLVIRNGQLIRVRNGNYSGIWRVFSAKNNASGMALDIGWADVVRLQNKTEGHKINVLLASLVKAGLEPLPAGLLGVPTVAGK
jgi:CRISPR-associated endonuclease Csn1